MDAALMEVHRLPKDLRFFPSKTSVDNGVESKRWQVKTKDTKNIQQKQWSLVLNTIMRDVSYIIDPIKLENVKSCEVSGLLMKSLEPIS